jgi:hypothetical protein
MTINDIEYAKNASTARAELLDKLKLAEDALRFYANVSDYKSPFTGGLGKLYYDCGTTAREALEAIQVTK